MTIEAFQPNDDFTTAVALDLYSGLKRVSSAGFSGALAASTETDIGLTGDTVILLPNNAGEALEIWSTNAGDNQDILIFGLGPDGTPLDPQTVTLNGTTPVSIPNNMSRVNDALNVSLTATVGTVNIGISPGTIYCNILPVHQTAKQTLYSVPVGFKLVIPQIIASFRKTGGGADIGVEITSRVKNFDQSFFYSGISFELQNRGNSSAQFADRFPEGIQGPFDIKVTANSTGANAEVIARFTGVLVEE